MVNKEDNFIEDFKTSLKDSYVICVLYNNIENKTISLLCYKVKNCNEKIEYDFSFLNLNNGNITQKDLNFIKEKYSGIVLFGTIIRKNNFNEMDDWRKRLLIISENENTRLFHQNDIFYKYSLKDISFLSESEVEFIYPINNIEKLVKRSTEIFEETSEIYNQKIKEYIDNSPKNHKKFIDNILYNNKEEIFLTYKPDNNLKESFLITKDYKFKDSIKTGFYYLGIVFDEEIRSVRDLKRDHLNLLKNLLKAKKDLEILANEELSKNGINRNVSLRAFIHYHPSFYHFHVHYIDTILNIDNCKINRAIDLNDIIQNISIKDNYYQTVTLNIEVIKNSELYSLLQK